MLYLFVEAAQLMGILVLLLLIEPRLQQSCNHWTAREFLIKALMVLHACELSHFSCARFFVTLWAVAHQASLSMGFSRQEYWSGWPCPPPGDLCDPGTEPVSPISCIDSQVLYR